jgi:hypothetical protein
MTEISESALCRHVFEDEAEQCPGTAGDSGYCEEHAEDDLDGEV